MLGGFGLHISAALGFHPGGIMRVLDPVLDGFSNHDRAHLIGQPIDVVRGIHVDGKTVACDGGGAKCGKV